MNTKEFTKIWKLNVEELYNLYTSKGKEESTVSKLLLKLNLDDEKFEIVKKMIETILVDTHYTFLLGLDGSANIGGVQQYYKVLDENDNLIFQPGDLEVEAYEQLQENFKTK